MQRIPYKKIAAQLNSELSELSPRRKARVLDSEDVDAAIAALKKARRLEPDAETWTVHVRGGFVANSYRDKGESDELCIAADRTGDWHCWARRCPAQRRSHGMGSTLIARALMPGQTLGRIVVRR